MEDKMINTQETTTEEAENNEALVADDILDCDLDYNRDSCVGVLVVGALSAAVGAVLYTNRKKIHAWRNDRKIKKLQKEGYIVSKIEDDAVESEDAVESDEDTEE